jgi:hypothetical protein
MQTIKATQVQRCSCLSAASSPCRRSSAACAAATCAQGLPLLSPCSINSSAASYSRWPSSSLAWSAGETGRHSHTRRRPATTTHPARPLPPTPLPLPPAPTLPFGAPSAAAACSIWPGAGRKSGPKPSRCTSAPLSLLNTWMPASLTTSRKAPEAARARGVAPSDSSRSSLPTGLPTASTIMPAGPCTHHGMAGQGTAW